MKRRRGRRVVLWGVALAVVLVLVGGPGLLSDGDEPAPGPDPQLVGDVVSDEPESRPVTPVEVWEPGSATAELAVDPAVADHVRGILFRAQEWAARDRFGASFAELDRVSVDELPAGLRADYDAELGALHARLAQRIQDLVRAIEQGRVLRAEAQVDAMRRESHADVHERLRAAMVVRGWPDLAGDAVPAADGWKPLERGRVVSTRFRDVWCTGRVVASASPPRDEVTVEIDREGQRLFAIRKRADVAPDGAELEEILDQVRAACAEGRTALARLWLSHGLAAGHGADERVRRWVEQLAG